MVTTVAFSGTAWGRPLLVRGRRTTRFKKIYVVPLEVEQAAATQARMHGQNDLLSEERRRFDGEGCRNSDPATSQRGESDRACA